jgi:hypothetical protein
LAIVDSGRLGELDEVMAPDCELLLTGMPAMP